MTAFGANDALAFRRQLRRVANQLDRSLPWSNCGDPWAVLVSEVMLQQTQVSRVKEAWPRFLERFPTPEACANASLDDVLRQWSGLGYARRARALYLAAKEITQQHEGVVPRTLDQLQALPGVGNYTSRAVASFAYGEPVAVLDTNVGRILARALANTSLTPREAQALADAARGRIDSALWNQAMLDLGAQFCKATPLCATCPVRTVCAWQREGGPDPSVQSAAVSRPQPRFHGSLRQQRGTVLRVLGEAACTRAQLAASEGVDEERLDRVLFDLERDGLITKTRRRWSLATS